MAKNLTTKKGTLVLTSKRSRWRRRTTTQGKVFEQTKLAMNLTTQTGTSVLTTKRLRWRRLTTMQGKNADKQGCHYNRQG